MPESECVYVGIDPGFTGAIAMLGGGNPPDVEDLRVIGEKTTKRLDAVWLYHVLKRIRCEHRARGDQAVAVIERAQTMPGQGIASASRYVSTYAVAIAMCEVNQIPTRTVSPGVWKVGMGLRGLGKESSRELALRLFPSCRTQLSRKKDHNRAEALLLAEWARREG